jgi:beta-galactosidase
MCAGGPALRAAQDGAADSLDFRTGWRFTKGDPDGAASSDFDDASWTPVRLPHDWAIAGPFDPQAPSGASGKLPWKGVGWYRKTFALDRREGDRVYLDFDGVMAFPQVYINGQLAGEWDYGYTSFRIDATELVDLRGRNVVAVRVDTTQHGTRWYPGAGIYRSVMLELRGPVHVAQWGVFVTTPKVVDQRAVVAVEAAVENHADRPTEAAVDFIVLDPARKQLIRRSEEVTLAPGQKTLRATLDIDQPRRWDIDDPTRYTLRTVVRAGGAVVDQQDVRFGIRSVELTADGLYLNGRRVQLRGVNLHHDQGPLGAAFYARAMERQLEIMMDMGVNAIRTAHNPPAAEMLELCDRMGLLVWDECFDKWDATAGRVRGGPSHEAHAERHLRSMVMRDRNHPSVFVWSIGNEIGPGGEGLTPERVAMMRDVVRKFDTTRPVGIASNLPELGRGEMFESLDFVGWNYCRHYTVSREHYPDRPNIYSESAAAVSTRGFYELPLPVLKTDYSRQYQVSSYDYNTASWADVPDREFDLMQEDQYVAGEFVWSGFDYVGEPTPFDNVARSSYFGAVDLCGIPKDRFWLYRSHWRPDEPTVHLLPHWNWSSSPSRRPVPVFVYTNGDSAELFLNGRSLGRRVKGVAPPRPENFAATARVTASSSRPAATPEFAVDGNYIQRWFASSPDPNQWLELDLGELRPIRCLEVSFEREAKRYGYVVKASADGRDWQSIVTHPASDALWSDGAGMHQVDTSARYIRIEIDDIRSVAWATYWASIREVGVYPEPVESAFYVPTYDYRLRWNAVPYEPGELTAVAYRNGAKVGEATVRTAGEPAQLRLRPDRTELAATGDDLCYVLVESLDKEGVECPLADHLVRFSIDGPAEIAGVGNGNPMSFEPFQARERKLFQGKAMLILRTLEGEPGTIRIVAASDGLAEDQALCVAKAP